LRSYPGPKLWAAFRFPFVYYWLKGKLPLRLKGFTDQYGPVVRVAPNELVFTTAAAWKDIYGFRPGQSQNPRDPSAMPATHKGQAVSILRADDADLGRQRRVLAHAFSAEALEEQQPLIMFYVDLLVRRLRENAAESQNMVAWYNRTTFDIIGDLTFGESFYGLQDQRWHPWVETITEGLEAAGVITALRRYGLEFALQFLVPKAKLDKFNRMAVYLKEKVGARLARSIERPDFMSYIMRNDKEGRQMSKGELEPNAEVLVVAGSETTAALLAGATYYLCMYPDALVRVTAEVRDEFDSDRDIQINSVNKLGYLLAVLNESLLMYPPTPSAMPRMTVKGDMIAGQWVAPGVSKSIHMACVQRPRLMKCRQPLASSSSPPTTPPPISMMPNHSYQSAGFLMHLPSSAGTTKMCYSLLAPGPGTV
jgi:cytochrome P450